MSIIKKFDTETNLTFEVMPPMYLPFYNRWGQNAYYTYDPFDYDPINIRGVSTSGSPVILVGNKFFGFMNETGGRFAYDGKYTLTITCPAGQSLWYSEDCRPYDEWALYNEAVIASLPPSQQPEKFWSDLEYCTWVDQKKEAVLLGDEVKYMWSVLTEDYVYNYMRRVEKLGLPKGKLTIDDGWDIRYAPDGQICYGNWQIDRTKFPHMEQLVRDMTNEGFIPGLWFAPFMLTPNSEYAKQNPHLLGETFEENPIKEPWNRRYIKPDPVVEKYYEELFTPFVEMGFRKFKLDMSYGPKQDMKKLFSMISKVVKKIEPSVELEGHIPDIFVSRYCDTVRINDVSFDSPSWRSVSTEHYKVCRHSSPDKILNLDHLGTNTPTPKEEDFMAHSEMLLKLKGGYPCVSLLPDFFNQKAADQFRGMIRDWVSESK